MFFSSSPCLGFQHSQLLALGANLGMPAVVLELDVLETLVCSKNLSCNKWDTSESPGQSSGRNSTLLLLFFGFFRTHSSLLLSFPCKEKLYLVVKVKS